MMIVLLFLIYLVPNGPALSFCFGYVLGARAIDSSLIGRVVSSCICVGLGLILLPMVLCMEGGKQHLCLGIALSPLFFFRNTEGSLGLVAIRYVSKAVLVGMIMVLIAERGPESQLLANSLCITVILSVELTLYFCRQHTTTKVAGKICELDPAKWSSNGQRNFYQDVLKYALDK
jgi:hypothetical protein